MDLKGGPAVGDIRSRCLRLSDENTSEALAVRRLLGHRLPIDASEAKSEWYAILVVQHQYMVEHYHVLAFALIIVIVSGCSFFYEVNYVILGYY